MWPGRTSRSEHHAFWRKSKKGEAPPYAPELVRRLPKRFRKTYEKAFSDGLRGKPPQSDSPLYLKWHREGAEFRELIGREEGIPLP